MPSTITHSYIGIDVLKKLNHKPKEIINKRLDNYKIYCQSMDPLYFYHIFMIKKNYVQELGHAFHRERIFKYFNLLIEDNKNNKDLELFTFIAGLITHYQADSIIHPFINYLAYNDDLLLQIDKHFEIETYIDNYFINKYETNNYKRINNTNLVFNYTKKDIIKDELNKLFKTIWNTNNMGKIYYKSLKEMKFIFKYIRHDKYGIKRKFYKLIDITPFKVRRLTYLSYHFNLDNDNYYLNLNHNIWFNNKENSDKSFLNLYNDTVDSSSYIINELYEYIFNNKKIDLKKIIGNNSYSSGLPL